MSVPAIFTRRQAFGLVAAAVAMTGAGSRNAFASATFGDPQPFSATDVEAIARAMAAKPYMMPKTVPDPWLKLNYDQYRDIRFLPDRAIWRDEGRPFEIQLFAPGFYFRTGVMIDVVEDGQSRPILFNPDLFSFGPVVPDLPIDAQLGFSGFRLHGHINRDDYMDEFVVFQGASYFRAVAKGQNYGLSARGLALNTAESQGEEFPMFRRFWIEVPGPDATSVTVHALLDSESVTGAYRFVIAPGDDTVMDCSLVLFPRVELNHVGIAPLTSMFMFDPKLAKRFDDFRVAVHDSDGLSIHNGNDEHLWRPLANPLQLQVSNFLDTNPKGFGLMQRHRNFRDFGDLEASYEGRPCLWIEPDGEWGRGAVSLVEIPTDEEFNDNIVAYWRPSEPMEPDSEHRFAYRAVWGKGPRPDPDIARVASTAFGKHPKKGRLAVVDFSAPESGRIPADKLTYDIHVTGGTLLNAVVHDNDKTGGTRVAFSFDPGAAETVELRAQLRHEMRPVSEVWLFRWTSAPQ